MISDPLNTKTQPVLFVLRDGVLGPFLHMSGGQMTFDRAYAWEGRADQLAVMAKKFPKLQSQKVKS